LAGVSGEISAGKVMAIMGPSGAGKTTFLNTLAGRASYGTTTGKVHVNGKLDSIRNYSALVGFVPQDDTMLRELTVRDTLKMYAKLRLPADKSKHYAERVVQDVIEVLQLTHISDSVIGDEDTRGISGGQRKRVNVGMEMVAMPSLLFLDEPTSGLDSTTSFDLLVALGTLAKKGCNILAVLHQPSFQLYEMFDSVLLLGKGGRTVYLGASSEALTYFTRIGFECPDRMNPADFFLDAIAGKFQREFVPTSTPLTMMTSVEEESEDNSKWEDRGSEDATKSHRMPSTSRGSNSSVNSEGKSKPGRGVSAQSEAKSTEPTPAPAPTSKPNPNAQTQRSKPNAHAQRPS
jgi:ABC-type multidrug transport system ATPase subunit